MSAPRPAQAHTSARPIESVSEANAVIANLESIMDSLLATVEEETALVRAGQLHEAAALEPAKAEFARAYAAETIRIKISREFLSKSLPDALAALRRRHDNFHALLQINLTVLATAHAVSEGIIRGVSGELARKHVPQTYGASGRTNSPGPKAGRPLALSRVL
ncbi:MAG TPA: hypothetical protein VFS63_13660 [Pseudolabrys sp.]|jgi:hypothetical protein|nr:hypothetical protein [Pseudolabrys sp.]